MRSTRVPDAERWPSPSGPLDMNRTQAIAILRRHLDQLEALGYDALSSRVGANDASEEKAETGVPYQIELSVVWDHRPNGAIRIIASIDDGGLRAFVPLTDSRLVQPQPGPHSS